MFKALALLATTMLTSATLSAAVKIEKIPYDGWPNCYRITNGEVELIVTTDVGPRVMRYSFVGGQNLFAEFKDELGKSGEKKWFGRGGHRFWAGPESITDTYALDNGPVKATINGSSITLLQPVEPETGLQKEITVTLAAQGSGVIVTHRLKNAGTKPRRQAPWALTQMTTGGVAIAAFPPRGTHEAVLLPTNPLTMWAYTDFSDKRWTFTTKYIALKQDPHNRVPQKVGLFNPKTFAAYLLGSELFTKRSDADPKADYPDFNCSYEMFTNDQFLEMETLGPLAHLAPGQSVTHTERWSLHKNVHIGNLTDAEIDRVLMPLTK
jgi:hypothetical protein